jgi:hypothetical protein
MDRLIVMAATVLGSAAIVFGVTLARALTLEPEAVAAGPPESSAPVESPDLESPASPRVPSAGRLDREAIRLAVDNDPFQPDRRRADAYIMPGEDIEIEEEPPPPPPPPFRLLGTAQADSGGYAVMQVEDAPPKVLGLGETIMGYRLENIDGVAATLTGQGRTLTITVADATPQPETRRGARGARGARGNQNNPVQGVLERVQQQLLNGERLQQMIQQLRERGVPPEVLEQLIRQQEAAMGGVEFRIEGSRGPATVRMRRDTSSVPEPRLPNEPRWRP